MKTVRTPPAIDLVAYLRAAGHDVEGLMRRAGVSAEMLSDPLARMPVDIHARLWDEATRLDDDVALGMRVATTARVGSYRPLFFLTGSSPTVGSALVRQSAHSGWSDQSVRYEIRREGSLHAVDMHIPDMSTPAARQYALHIAAVTAWGFRAVVQDFSVHSVQLQGEDTRDTRPLESYFLCPFRFGGVTTTTYFTPAQWEAPIFGANPILLKLVEGYLLAARTFRPDAVERVRALLASMLGRSPLSLEDAARRLGMSARTLQRVLREAGTSFSAVLDQVRLELAQRFLGDPGWTLSEIADYLGFSDQSAFTRAYKRWTGAPPTLAREASPPRPADPER